MGVPGHLPRVQLPRLLHLERRERIMDPVTDIDALDGVYHTMARVGGFAGVDLMDGSPESEAVLDAVEALTNAIAPLQV